MRPFSELPPRWQSSFDFRTLAMKGQGLLYASEHMLQLVVKPGSDLRVAAPMFPCPRFPMFDCLIALAILCAGIRGKTDGSPECSLPARPPAAAIASG